MSTREAIPAVFEALRKFINQRPNLDAANYGCHPEQLAYSSLNEREDARRSMQSELRSIQKAGTRARKALREALTYEYNFPMLGRAFKSAFSGRLSWNGSELEYCTGQYYPTEYRIAAAKVLEQYCHDVRPKFTPKPGQSFTSISDIEAASQRAGSHWFDAGTKGFFRSRILPYVFQGQGGIYFVSSEKGPNEIRRFTIRKFNPENADISTFGPFNELTRERALRFASIASEFPEAALEALNAGK
jgi:hypothetical protein